ncbi:DUF445 family protein [Clostridium colicanis]|uniref:DUF445 family protein n=1 Tax=Clostridium colicanis DSM 13634 TaxID=1121305 RepID=A0A151APR6_9CLOT|nr:DUF445 family protein [Clostridium colicanis]KYH29631.1 hypothetical protein CLCOL_08620 [Clostridium colicanis DSM 13634]
MPYTRVLFSAIVGAIIGYITNWLAIKMLFRPHEEKRIFGLKVPFTPGLIPKEQKRIAKSVADAIGNHLLTSDTMLEALQNNGIDKKFESWIEGKALEISRKTISIGEQIKIIVGEKFHGVIKNIKDKMSTFFILFIRKDKVKCELEKLVLDVIKKELSKDPNIILESDYYKNIRNEIIKKSAQYKNSEEFKKNIEELIKDKISNLEDTDKSLEEVIPVGIISTIKVYVYSKNYDIAMKIKETLKEEEVQTKLKKFLSDMISININPMIAMFLNTDTIYSKLVPAIDNYLDKEENQREIALLINSLIDKALKTKVGDILSNISEESKERNIEAIGDIIIDKVIDEKVISAILSALEDKVRDKETLQELFSEFNINTEEVLTRFIGIKIDEIIDSSELEEKIREYTNSTIDNILNIKISDLSNGKEAQISKIALKTSEGLFNRFVTSKAVEFIEALDIRKIVEDKINSFEVSFAEEIILEIASRELNAITSLGALLGFIMGLLSAIMAAI